MPTDTGSDALAELSIVPSLSSSSADDPAVITFTRPLAVTYTTDAEIKDLAQEINQPIIYALGPTNPGNSDPTTDIEQHSLDSMGAT